MSAEDTSGNPTDAAPLTPQQLEMRLAQAKAEAEAARLQAEVLKLQAQLEQAKTQETAAMPAEQQAAKVDAAKGNAGQEAAEKDHTAPRAAERAAPGPADRAEQPPAATSKARQADRQRTAKTESQPKAAKTVGAKTDAPQAKPQSADRWSGRPTSPEPPGDQPGEAAGQKAAQKKSRVAAAPAPQADASKPQAEKQATKAKSSSAPSTKPAERRSSAKKAGPDRGEQRVKSPPPLPAGRDDSHAKDGKPSAAKSSSRAAAATSAAAAAVSESAEPEAATTNQAADPATGRSTAGQPQQTDATPGTVPTAAPAAVPVSLPAAVPVSAPAAGQTVAETPQMTAADAGSDLQPDGEQEGELFEEEEEDRRSWATFMLAVPSWMVSFLVHLVILLAAALLTFTVEDSPVKRFLIADATEVEDQELEAIEMENEPEMDEVVIQAIPTPDVMPGAADFGDIDGMEQPTSDVSIGLDTTDSQLSEIGTLFGTGGSGMANAGEGMGGEFFGVKATGSRFIFVVDSSLSMKRGKFEAACQELFYSVSRLTEEQSFYVIFFDWDGYRMFDLKNPERRMVRATPANMQRLQQWMPKVELELKTNPYDAMEFAMSLMPDAIYVLSDGAFTDGGRTVNWLKKVNLVEDELDGKKPVVTIHTIGFYTEDKGTLKQMADTYGGTYRFVPAPPNFKKRKR